MAQNRNMRFLKTGRSYGIGLAAIVLLSLLSWLVYPASTQTGRSFVFLRTTLPVSTDTDAELNLQIPAVQPQQQEEIENIVDEIDPDLELVEMLLKDDSEVIYETMEDKESWHVVHMRVTGYCACPKCCGKFSDGRTASNHRIKRGDVFVAADKRYRFGTEMIIPGYNATQTVSVQDRGRVIKGNRLDLYFDSHQQAKKWGVKYLNVMVREQ